MEKRDRGIDKKRVTRDQIANDPVGYLVKTSTGDDTRKFFAVVEYYFEQNGDQPEKQSGRKEDSCLVILFMACVCH